MFIQSRGKLTDVVMLGETIVIINQKRHRKGDLVLLRAMNISTFSYIRD